MKITTKEFPEEYFHEFETIEKLEDFLLSKYFGKLETQKREIFFTMSQKEIDKFNLCLQKQREQFGIIEETKDDLSTKREYLINGGTIKVFVED